MNILITVSLFLVGFIFWPPTIKSVSQPTPYLTDVDLGLLWFLAIIWSVYAVYYFIKEMKGGKDV
jgi:cytochrome c oxidase assembly factor CtaG